MFLIDRSWAAIANVASEDVTRPNLNGVHVTATPETVRAEATDGAVLLRVEAPRLPDADYPVFPGLEAGTLDAGIIPAVTFAKALKSNKVKSFIPILRNVAVSLQDGDRPTATLAFTDLENPTITRTPLVEEKFPNVDQVIPKGDAVATFSVDPVLLAELLLTIADVLPDGRKGLHLVTFSIYTNGTIDKPVRLDANEDGTTALGIIAQRRAK